MRSKEFLIYLGDEKERLPIVIVDCYVLLTLFLYYFGPVRFHSPYNFELISYLFLFLIVSNIAYFRALWVMHKRSEQKKRIIELDKKTDNLNALPSWFYFVGMLIPFSMFFTSLQKIEFRNFSGSLTSIMAQAYAFVQSGGLANDGLDVPMWIYMHFAIFVYLTILDGLLHFERIGLTKKLMWGASLLFLVGYFVLFKGTQKTLGDVFVLCASALLIKMCVKKHGITKKNSKKILLLLIVLALVFAYILATILGERIQYLASFGYEAFKLDTVHWSVDLDNALISIFPESAKIGVSCLVFYLCNGLCGLSYCLKAPFTWSYGLGSLPDLSDIFARRFGIDVTQSTYMYEAYEIYGWHHKEVWHTLFPSLASDWTFIGTLVLLGIVMYYYAQCWIEAINRQNKESMFLFSIMNIIWVYLPANNQIFSTRTTSLVFFISIIMWAIRRKNARIKI